MRTTASSASVIPTVASTTNITASATETAISACAAIALGQPAGVGVPAAGVDDGEGAAVPVRVVGDPVAGHAGDVLHDRLAAADDPVHQRRLADVRAGRRPRATGVATADVAHDAASDERDDLVDDLVERELGGVDVHRAVGHRQRRGGPTGVDPVALEQPGLGGARRRRGARARRSGAGRGPRGRRRGRPSPRPAATPPSRCRGPRRRCRRAPIDARAAARAAARGPPGTVLTGLTAAVTSVERIGSDTSTPSTVIVGATRVGAGLDRGLGAARGHRRRRRGRRRPARA